MSEQQQNFRVPSKWDSDTYEAVAQFPKKQIVTVA